MKNIAKQAERGFTLLEVLVVLVIVGVLAAFVLPDIINRSDDAEPARVAGDLRGVSEAIHMFHLDTRNAFPGDLEDLAHRVEDGVNDKTIEGAFYLDRHNQRWDGAYLKAALAETGVATASSDKMKTGFDGFVLSPLTLWNSKKTNTENTTAATAPTSCADNVFVTVRVQGLSQEEFEAVNTLIDGDDETAAADEGNLRYISSGDTGDTYYLAVSCR